MKRYLFRSILALGILVIILSSCSHKPTIRLPLDELNFQVRHDYVYICGYGDIESGKRFSEADAQEKAMARRAAILDAKRNFLRYMGKAKKIKEGSKLQETLSGMVLDGQPVQEDIIKDLQIKVTYRFLLNGKKGLNEVLGVDKIYIKHE